MSDRDQFYSQPAWRAVRARYLGSHPRCSALGCSEPATQVDHIVARSAGGDDFRWSNLVSYCRGHHSQKTVQLDRGFGRIRSATFVPIVNGCKIDGRPADPAHPWNK